jgi:hypothetical protein
MSGGIMGQFKQIEQTSDSSRNSGRIGQPKVFLSDGAAGQRIRPENSAPLRATDIRAARPVPSLMQPIIVRMEKQMLSYMEWKHHILRILEITDHWKETGRWWDHEPPCEFFEVLTATGAYLLGYRESEGQWYGKSIQ